MKVQLLLSKFRLFNFDLSYLLYPLRYRVAQYLIRKLLDMVKMGIEGLAVAALLISVKASQKLKRKRERKLKKLFPLTYVLLIIFHDLKKRMKCN